MVYLVAVFFLLISSAAHAEVYKCEEGGEVIFSDSPCDSEEAGFGSTQYSAPETSSSVIEKAGSEQKGQARDFLSERARLKKEREIESLESEIQGLQKTMNSKLEGLSLKEARLTHNLDHTDRLDNIGKERGEIRERYRSEIREKTEELRKARGELRGMNK